MKVFGNLSASLRILAAGLSSIYPLFLANTGMKTDAANLIVIVSFNTIFVYIAGLEMHALANRSVANGLSPIHVLSRLFRVETVFVICLIPIALLTKWQANVEIPTWQLILLLVSTLSFQEVYRTLIASQLIKQASQLIFFKSIMPILITQCSIIEGSSIFTVTTCYVLSTSLFSLISLAFALIFLKNESGIELKKRIEPLSFRAIIGGGLLILPHSLMLRLFIQYEILNVSQSNNVDLIIWAGYQVTAMSFLLLLQDSITIQPWQSKLYRIKELSVPLRIKEYSLQNILWCILALPLQIVIYFVSVHFHHIEFNFIFFIVPTISCCIILLYTAAFPIALGMRMEKQFLFISLLVIPLVFIIQRFNFSILLQISLKLIILACCAVYASSIFIRSRMEITFR